MNSSGGWAPVLLIIAVLAAIALLVVVALDGPGWVLLGSDAGLSAGRLAALLLVLIAIVGIVVPAFAARYLAGDPRFARFFLLTGITVTATAAMVAAATVVGLVVAWVIAGAGLVALIAHERDLPASRVAARRAANDQSALGMLITVVPDDQVDALLAGVRTLLGERSGVMFVSDVYVSRPEYFTT